MLTKLKALKKNFFFQFCSAHVPRNSNQVQLRNLGHSDELHVVECSRGDATPDAPEPRGRMFQKSTTAHDLQPRVKF